jgi:hypothetical protein
VFISVGATQGEKLFDGAVLTVKYFFDAVGVQYSGDLLIRGIDKFWRTHFVSVKSLSVAVETHTAASV